MPAHTTFFVKKEIYEKYGLYDTSFRIASDYDLMMRYLGLHRINVYYLDEFIVHMRTGGASNKVGNYFQKWKEDYRAIRRNKIGGLHTLFFKNVRKVGQFFH
jgi:glycosyltransferase